MTKGILILYLILLCASPSVYGQQKIEHIVKPGDNLYEISIKYNKLISRLVKDNSLKDPETLFIGDTIFVLLPKDSKYLKATAIADAEKNRQDSIQAKIIIPNKSELSDSTKRTPKPPLLIDEEASFLSAVFADKVTRWVIYTNTILLFLTFLMIVIIILSRIIKNIIRKRKTRLSEYFENVITGYLFRSTSDEIDKKNDLKRFENQEIAKTGFQKSLLSKMLIKLHRDFIGESEQDLKQMFVLHKLDKSLQKNIKSRRWHIRASSIHSIGSMRLFDLKNDVKLYSRDKNKDVRFEVLLTLLQTEDENPLQILDHFDGKLDTWRQVQLFYALDKLSPAKIVLANRWFNHPEPTIVQFAVRLAARYNQSAVALDLFKLLEHQSLRVRLSAIKAFGELSIYESIDFLQQCFPLLGYEEKKMIIRVVSLLQFETNTNFYIKVIEKELFPLKLEAAKALYSIPSGLELLEKMINSSNKEHIKLARHAMDKRL